MGTLAKSTAWAIILRGVLFLLFGLLSIFIATNSLYGPIFYLGVLFLATGGIYAIVSLSLRKNTKAWLMWLLWAIVDLSIGIYIILKTERAADLFTILIGSWAVVMSLAMFIAAFKVIGYRVLIIINGMVSLVFGLVILFNPFPAIMGLNTLIGLYTILFGLTLGYLGYRLLTYKAATDESNNTQPPLHT